MPAVTNLDPSARVVVAGAGGFIGGALVGHLIQQGFTDVRVVDIRYRTSPAEIAKGRAERSNAFVGAVGAPAQA